MDIIIKMDIAQKIVEKGTDIMLMVIAKNVNTMTEIMTRDSLVQQLRRSTGGDRMQEFQIEIKEELSQRSRECVEKRQMKREENDYAIRS